MDAASGHTEQSSSQQPEPEGAATRDEVEQGDAGKIGVSQIEEPKNDAADHGQHHGGETEMQVKQPEQRGCEQDGFEASAILEEALKGGLQKATRDQLFGQSCERDSQGLATVRSVPVSRQRVEMMQSQRNPCDQPGKADAGGGHRASAEAMHDILKTDGRYRVTLVNPSQFLRVNWA